MIGFVMSRRMTGWHVWRKRLWWERHTIISERYSRRSLYPQFIPFPPLPLHPSPFTLCFLQFLIPLPPSPASLVRVFFFSSIYLPLTPLPPLSCFPCPPLPCTSFSLDTKCLETRIWKNPYFFLYIFIPTINTYIFFYVFFNFVVSSLPNWMASMWHFKRLLLCSNITGFETGFS